MTVTLTECYISHVLVKNEKKYWPHTYNVRQTCLAFSKVQCNLATCVSIAY